MTGVVPSSEDGTPVTVVDARGMRCPWPVLRAAKALREHQAVLIHTDDPRAEVELQALAQERAWAFTVRADGVFFVSRD
ncbi:MAG: sulfurtransferase TusA family protein [Sphingobium sp.]|nr:sulfurtransferase TusA family protein [Sphingobium sp.]